MKKKMLLIVNPKVCSWIWSIYTCFICYITKTIEQFGGRKKEVEVANINRAIEYIIPM